MIIHHDPDAHVAVVTHNTCAFHQKNPGVPYAGCGCSGSYGLRKATPEEYARNRKQRLESERESLRRRLQEIDREIGK